MAEHKWLTEEEVAAMYDDFEQIQDRDLCSINPASTGLSDMNRLIADWQKGRRLLSDVVKPACEAAWVELHRIRKSSVETARAFDEIDCLREQVAIVLKAAGDA